MQKNNHPSKPVRYSFTELVKSAEAGENNGFKMALDEHRRDIRNVIANNQHMLTIAGKSAYAQLREIYANTRLVLTKQSYSDLKRGERVTCSITPLILIAQYWGLCLRDMLQEPEEFAQMVERKGMLVA